MTNPSDRTKIAILFGGASEEHPVSVKSAREVARQLDPDRYQPSWIKITTDGSWILCDGPFTDRDEATAPTAVVSPDRRSPGLVVLTDGRYELLGVDLVFPVLHGRFGEDGSIQGLLELSGIPYVGCDVQASTICMDKALTYRIVRDAGIATPTFWTVGADDDLHPDDYPYPIFVKPARSGSSFGVSKVERPGELVDAVRTARRYDSRVLIEQAVAGREIGCAILGERFGLATGELDHVALSHGFFRIHQEDAPETGSENTSFVVPADVPDATRRHVQETAKRIYRAVGCTGLARVDLFLTDDDRVVLNEINTMPGLTSYSRYPRMMAAAGLTLADVIDRLVWHTLHGKRR